MSAVVVAGLLSVIPSAQKYLPLNQSHSAQSNLKNRQETLEELTQDPRIDNFSDVVMAVVYDPDFTKYESELHQLLIDGMKTNNTALIASANVSLQTLALKRTQTPYATTLPEGKLSFAGKKSTIFVGREFFDKLTKDDQVSVLDHERLHAKTHKYGLPFDPLASKQLASVIPGKKLPEEIADEELINSYDEAFAYGWQLRGATIDQNSN